MAISDGAITAGVIGFALGIVEHMLERKLREILSEIRELRSAIGLNRQVEVVSK